MSDEVFEAALAVCNSAIDECRSDGQVLVGGSELQALNDALTVVEEADADEHLKPVTIPGDLYRFLMGDAPLDGVWFGEMNKGFRGAFWWRGLLRCAAGWPASVDTLPKGQDAKQGLAGTEGSAVGSEASETPTPSSAQPGDA